MATIAESKLFEQSFVLSMLGPIPGYSLQQGMLGPNDHPDVEIYSFNSLYVNCQLCLVHDVMPAHLSSFSAAFCPIITLNQEEFKFTTMLYFHLSSGEFKSTIQCTDVRGTCFWCGISFKLLEQDWVISQGFQQTPASTLDGIS